MKKKSELLKEVVLMMSAPRIEKWYNENLETKDQAETINSLETGINKKEITVREGLALALLVGVQWNENNADSILRRFHVVCNVQSRLVHRSGFAPAGSFEV